MITNIRRTKMIPLNNGIKKCQSCDVAYQWPKSQATLKQQFCSFFCEKKALGFHIDSFLKEGAYGKKSDHVPNKSESVNIPAPPPPALMEEIRKLDKDDDNGAGDPVPA